MRTDFDPANEAQVRKLVRDNFAIDGKTAAGGVAPGNHPSAYYLGEYLDSLPVDVGSKFLSYYLSEMSLLIKETEHRISRAPALTPTGNLVERPTLAQIGVAFLVTAAVGALVTALDVPVPLWLAIVYFFGLGLMYFMAGGALLKRASDRMGIRLHSYAEGQLFGFMLTVLTIIVIGLSAWFASWLFGNGA